MTVINRTRKAREAKAAETPTETPVQASTEAPTPTETPVKKDVLTPEAFAYRNSIWATLVGAKLAAVRAATSLAAIVAKFGQDNLPVGLTDDLKAFIASAVEGGVTKAERVPQFTPEAYGLVRNIKDEETLGFLRGGVFNGVTGVTLDQVLLALYVRNQAKDNKGSQLETDADGNAVILVCGCGVCNGRKFVSETWLNGRNERVGNYVPGGLLGSEERFVTVSRRCIGTINTAIFNENSPTKEANNAIAARRKAGEQTEPYRALKPMVAGLTSEEAGKVLKGQKAREDARERRENRLAAIVGGIHAPARTGIGREGYDSRPSLRRGERREGGRSRDDRY